MATGPLVLFRRLFGPCLHEDTYLERRQLGPVPGVLHLVCRRCARSRPALDRTLDEHARIRFEGQAVTPKARPVGNVLPMRRAR